MLHAQCGAQGERLISHRFTRLVCLIDREERVAIGIRGLLAAVIVLAGVGAASAKDALVVSIWGGNFRDGAQEAIATEFTKRTGIEVKFVTGGTMDRLTKAKLSAGSPEADVTLTTSHVAYLYVADNLFEKLDLSKIPNLKDAYPTALRSPYHIGLYSYVYMPAYRTDLMPKDFKITSWKDLWSDSVKGKLGLPDFDPSHIIVVAAKLSGGDATNWKVGIPMLLKLKPSIKAFYQSDAVSEDLIKTGETPVQVLLSINAYHQMSQGIPIKPVIPSEGGVIGIDAIGINRGSKMVDAAHKFIDVALDPLVQEKLCELYKCSPMSAKAHVSAELAALPGIFTSQEELQKQIIIDDETRAKLLPEWTSWFTENMTR
jgi:putative spermidine/putrescine transport system substrate-binding protein